jgi:hypothetical protein
VDSVGDAHGTLHGGATLAMGMVGLDGTEDYVELPQGILSNLTDVTLLAWIRWDGGDCWQRVFDFGEVVATDSQPHTNSTLYLTVRRCPGDLASAGFKDGQGQNEYLDSLAVLPTTRFVQVGVVFDSLNARLSLVLDGAVIAEQSTRLNLKTLRDVHSWLGRSQYNADPYLAGHIDEFRIYAQALNAETLAQTFTAGADQP